MSIPSVAVELAQRTLGELDDRRVLVVGAGETAELTARALAAQGVRGDLHRQPPLRPRDRPRPALRRPARCASRSCPSELDRRRHRRLLDQLAAPRDRARGAAEVMAAREGRPLLLIDLAVPRDIHPACREVAGVSLHDMDDLQALVERNASGREAEARRAEGDPARRAGALRALARGSGRDPDGRRAARARRRGRRAGAGRERAALGGAHRGRSRAARGGGAGDRVAPPARADAAAEARRRRGRRLREGRGRCASSSASTRRPSRSRRRGAEVSDLDERRAQQRGRGR